MHRQKTHRLLLLSLVFFIVSSVMSLLFATQTQAITSTLTLLKATPTRTPAVLPTSSPTKVPATSTNRSLFDQPFGILGMIDTFKRNDQLHWGESDDRVDWEGDARLSNDFVVKNHKGIISGRNKTYIAFFKTYGTTKSMTKVTASLSDFTTSNIGVLTAIKDANNWKVNWFGARVTNNALIIEQNVNGKITVLGTKPYSPEKNVNYTITVVTTGQNFIAAEVRRADKSGDSTDILVYVDKIESGFSGMYTTLSQGSVATITDVESGAIFSK